MNPTFLFLKRDDNDRNISEKKNPFTFENGPTWVKIVQLFTLLVQKFHKTKKSSPNGFFCIYFRIIKL